MTLSDLVAASADRPALLAESQEWSYRELASAAETLATALVARQTDVTRPIGHAFDLTPEGVVAALAVSKAGSRLAPAHTAWKRPERERFVRAIQPEMILSSEDRPWLDGEWRREVLLLPGFGPVSVCTRAVAAEDPGLSAPAGTEVALWTSGSGGAPKIVAHTWSALIANARAANERLGFEADSVWLTTLAWAHIGGLAVIPRAAAAGAALAFGATRFDASLALQRLRERGVTHVSLVPAMAHRLIGRAEPPPASLRVALVGGAAMPATVTARAVSEGWPISLTYGMTEAGSQVATASPEEARMRPNCVGLPLASAQVRIEPVGDDALGNGDAGQGPKTTGEICLRGPGLFLGYFGVPARDPATWFATGDLGALDEDGRLRVTGRRSARIVSGGANVDPSQVEAEVARHPDVREVCVVGVPDPVWGEVVACVVATGRDDIEEELDAWTKERLSGARAPRRWKTVPSLPRTATGKVDRVGVRELFTTDA